MGKRKKVWNHLYGLFSKHLKNRIFPRALVYIKTAVLRKPESSKLMMFWVKR